MWLLLLGLLTLSSGLGFILWALLGMPHGELCDSLCPAERMSAAP
jgi:hypothetical protein